MTALEELLRQVWTNVMEGHHDTKTDEQIEAELDDFINNMETELKLFSKQSVKLSMIDLVHWLKTQPDKNILRHTSDFIVNKFNKA